MTTPNRGYSEIPSTSAPDVPFYTNAALRQIDADVQSIDKTQEVADLEGNISDHEGRLALVESAAGFPAPPLSFQDAVVAALVNNSGSGVRAALAAAVTSQVNPRLQPQEDAAAVRLRSRSRGYPGKTLLRRVSTYGYWLGYQMDALRWAVYTTAAAPDAPGGSETKTLVQLDTFGAYLAYRPYEWNSAGYTWSGASWADNPTLNGRRATTPSDYARYTLPTGTKVAALRYNAHSNNGIAEVRITDDLGNTLTPAGLMSGSELLAAGIITQADLDMYLSSSARYINQHTWGAMTETFQIISEALDPSRSYTVTILATGVFRARSGTNYLSTYGGNPSAETDVSGWTGTAATITRVTTPVNAGGSTGAFKITASAAGSALSSRMDLNPRISVTAGLPYTFSASLHVGGQAGVDGAIRAYFMDAAGVTLSSTATSAVVATNGYTRVSVTGTAPTGAASVMLRVGLNAAHASGAYVYADDLMWEQSATMSAYTVTAPGAYATVSALCTESGSPNSGTTWVLDEQMGSVPGANPSAWEYALSVTIGGVSAFIGNQHGYDRPVALDIYQDGKLRTAAPSVGTTFVQNELTLVRTSDLYHPGTASKVATAKVTYSLSAASGFFVERDIAWLVAGRYERPYTVMWPTQLERVSWVGARQTWTADKNLDKDPLGQLGKVPYLTCYAWKKTGGNYFGMCEVTGESVMDYAWDPATYTYYEDRSADTKKLYVSPLGNGVTRNFAAAERLHSGSAYSVGRMPAVDLVLGR
jgi:hypothetical protein